MPEVATGEDLHWMQRALDLAEKSIGLSSPNPSVGCVLTQGGEVVGEGFHEYDNLDHAEIVALKRAGSRARGATAYVTLEPCCHHGRTGPCADALLAAGIRRVVVATRDPNPLVHGKGIARLLAGGVEVSCGELQGPARRINDAFARFTRSSLPFVTMKVASSLDGRIAPAWSSPTRITCEAAWEEVHRMRHSADALLTGVGTVLADNPRLTDRSGLPRRRPLLRVLLDSSLRTPLDSQLVAAANNDLLIFFTRASAATQRAFEDRGVRLERLGENGSRVPLLPALRHLADAGITSVLVEGGAEINTAFLSQEAVDKFVLFCAPTFLGGDAVPMLSSPVGPLEIHDFALKRFDRDFAFEAYLRDPWAGVD